MPQQKTLVQITWNEEKRGFVRKDTGRKVKTALPLGPLQNIVDTSEPAIWRIAEQAEKYRQRKPNAYEITKAAHDVHPQEFTLPEHAYTFRFYKIS